ncbi:MAG: hypothetical protein LH650_09395 [Chloroflexi bacterium]|nr:hypothetical protein [Chloroflexota bacterium]
MTLESDGSGAIYPVLFARVHGVTTEHVLEPDQMLRYDTAEATRSITEIVERVLH